MRVIAIALFTIAVALAASAVPVLHRDVRPLDIIEDKYIVVFKQNSTIAQRNAHINRLNSLISIKLKDQSQIRKVFSFGNFNAFSAKLSKGALASQMTADDIIEYIEVDRVMRMSQACSAQSDAIWNLDRVNERSIDLDGRYVYSHDSGVNADAYVIDTGVLITHEEFEGRAIWGANFADNVNKDCQGHGTHVAGTIAGKTYGIAKKTTIISVKVLDCEGSGSIESVVGGIEYTTKTFLKRKRPSVANMSLGGGVSAALDDAVAEAIKSGITFAVAAGNENTDACTTSPANVPTAITVGATTVSDDLGKQIDERASFSNYGSCVDILAPGELIKSAWIGSNSAVKTISGTSMATPHVAGVAALYLSEKGNVSPAQVTKYLLSQATLNKIDLSCVNADCKKTPNSLLYSACS